MDNLELKEVVEEMGKIDWKQKFSSRKFLTMLGLTAVLLVVSLFEKSISPDVMAIIDMMAKGCWIWMGTEGGVDMVRILSQAFVDKAKAENSDGTAAVYPGIPRETEGDGAENPESAAI